MIPETIREVPVDTVTGLAALAVGPLRLCEWLLLLVAVFVLLRTPLASTVPVASAAPTGGPLAMLEGRWTLAAVLASAFVIHAVCEGTRWQMLPLYGAVVLAMLMLTLPVWGGPPRLAPFWTHGAVKISFALKPVLWPLSMLGVAALAAACALASLVPLFHLPAPSGSLAVGTRLYEVVDNTRAETQGGDPGAHRRLMMQLWYPAEAGSGNGAAAYRTAGTSWDHGQWLASRYLTLSHQRLVATESAAGAMPLPAAQPYPVVLFAHAWGGSRIQDTALLQDLASHGYVVAAFDRPYNAGYVAYPDGTIVNMPGDMVLDTSTDRAFDRTLALGAAQAALGAADASAVLDALGKIAATGPFAGLIDTRHAAIFGHSFGGAVAGEACRRDRRFVTALNLDGWLFGGARDAGIPCPYMLINDGGTVPSVAALSLGDPAVRNDARMQIEDRQAQLHSLMEYGGWDLAIAGASHDDFTDRVFYARAKRLTHAGSLPYARVHDIVRHYALALAGWSLKGELSPLLTTAPAEYPEVSFRAWPIGGRKTLPGRAGG
jgi:predicted dienelactone hydrolase